MNRDEVFDIVCSAISEVLSIKKEDITGNMRFMHEINLDSIDVTELMMIAEEEFDLQELMADDIMDIVTVDDAVEFVMSKKKN